MKKFLLSLVALVGLGFAASADEVSVTFSSLGYTNGAEITNVKMNDDISLTFDKGTNSNPPKYYSTGTSLRLYGSNTMTVKAVPNYTITELVISGSDTKNCINSESTVKNNSGSDNGNLNISGTSATWTGESDNITFTQGGASGHARISTIKVTYINLATDTRVNVNLSFPEDNYLANMADKDSFVSPKLTCDNEEALSAVVFSSSDQEVATVDEQGNVTLIKDGITTISASIPAENTQFKASSVEYLLTVVDPNAPTTPCTLNSNFFGGTGSAYIEKTVADSNYGIEFSTVFLPESNAMQYNSNANNGKGSGICVTTINPNYNIKNIHINYVTGQEGAGLDVFVKDKAFATPGKKTAINTEGATQVNENPIKVDITVPINAPAFAIVPADKGIIQVTSITVTYALNVEDGSVDFKCDGFKEYMISKEESFEIELPEDAPEVTYTTLTENIVSIEGNTFTALNHGSTTVVATWDAVPGKWLSGWAKFPVRVKYTTLAEVLADAEKTGEGFVNEGETYVGNFPVTIVSDNGLYNYVTDGTAWALFYVDHKHKDGSVLPAGWSGTYTKENGVPEFKDIKHVDIEDVVEVVLKEYSDIEITESMVNEVLILKDVTIKEATPADQSEFTAIFNGKEYLFYNQFSKESIEPGSYNVKGVVDIDPDNGLEIFPIEYFALEATTAAVHVDAELKVGEQIKFTGLEEGAHVYYRHGGENPDHTNVFTEETTPANAPRKAADVDKAWTYNHTTHPLTYQGEPMQVKYYAKAPGKAPSAVNELNVDENGSTTGIENIAVDAANGAVEYFNLQGIRVVNPENGVFIRRQGNDVKKVVL
ncbi:MAG: Ig-like domain-containing protein [Duncaniella sp.]|nr:Ig-like domain-containing protein [Duncaniella sp.]